MPFDPGWVDITQSNTTNRNTSRFILTNPARASHVSGGVNPAVHLRHSDSNERGPAFLLTENDPVRLWDSGDTRA